MKRKKRTIQRKIRKPKSEHKFVSVTKLLPILNKLRKQGKTIVFTNGCFDLIHPGHVHLLKRASSFGEILVVAINTDASVRRLKGPGRPIFPLRERAEIVSSFEFVDYVVSFGEATPASLIDTILPDVLVKGGDWKPSTIVGRQSVERRGGKVITIPLRKGRSTTVLIERIINRFANEG